MLAAEDRIDLKVYYSLLPDNVQQGTGFGIPFSWDIPLLDGYAWEVLPNKAEAPSLTGFFGSSTPAVYSRFRVSRPDVVILTGWHARPLLQAMFACVRLGIPMIVRGESNSMKRRNRLIQMLHRQLLVRFNAFLTIGLSNREFYVGYGVPPDRIFDCPYFVDNDRFSTKSDEVRPDRALLRKSWGIGEKDVCFLFAGKLQVKKRPMDFLKALVIAAKENPQVTALVAGTGELMEEAKTFVRTNNLRAIFAGFLNQTEIAKAYVAADCLVLPSDFGETWGLVVNEAMVCGLPAIVSDRVGCGPDLVKDGITGFIFPFGDIRTLAGMLVDAASNHERLVQMGRNAAERVIMEYSVEKAVEGTLKAIEFATSR